MTTREALLEQYCRPRTKADALSAAEIKTALADLPTWTFEDGALQRSLEFKDYFATMAFINALAFVIHREDHHPDITFGYNHATVRFNTHSAEGITDNDFICAAKSDALYDARHG